MRAPWIRCDKGDATPRRRGSGAGFTILEMMVVVLIWSFAVALTTTMYIGQQRNMAIGNSYAHINNEARTAMDWLAKDLRNAVNLVSAWGGYTKSNNCVVFKIPSIDANHDVIDVESKHDYVIYRLNPADNTKLERILDADQDGARTDETRTIASNVGRLYFGNSGVGLGSIADAGTLSYLDIEITTNRTIGTVAVTNNLSTKVSFRNKEI